MHLCTELNMSNQLKKEAKQVLTTNPDAQDALAPDQG
jgi:hypothetical protein